jgi:hypothetical protein
MRSNRHLNDGRGKKEKNKEKRINRNQVSGGLQDEGSSGRQGRLAQDDALCPRAEEAGEENHLAPRPVPCPFVI